MNPVVPKYSCDLWFPALSGLFGGGPVLFVGSSSRVMYHFGIPYLPSLRESSFISALNP